MNTPHHDPPIIVTKHAHPEERRDSFCRALLANVIFVGGLIFLLWLVNQWHLTGIDRWADRWATHLTGPAIADLMFIHLALALVMIIKGPANGLERSLTRFMLGKAFMWGYVWQTEQPMPPTQLLFVLVMVSLTALDVFCRLFATYVWPVARIVLPRRFVAIIEGINARVRRLAFWRGSPRMEEPGNSARRRAFWRQPGKGTSGWKR